MSLHRVFMTLLAIGIACAMAQQGLTSLSGAIPPVRATDGDAPRSCMTIQRADGPHQLCRGTEPGMHGYDRTQFGSGWIDADHDCLDTRAEILARDGQGVQVDGCRVVAGRWTDPYTGAVETDPSHVHVDHVYPLAEAWRNGANRWGANKRMAFANDPLNLMALIDRVNERKSDQDSSEWCTWQIGESRKAECPVKGSAASYAARYDRVGTKYGI